MSPHRTALVTGASSGIGAAFARRLAAQGCDVILVARRQAELARVAGEIEQRFPVRTEILTADLATSDGMDAVARRLTASTPHWLINNAGFGIPGPFHQVPLNRILALIRLHVIADVVLCHTALPGMVTRGHGRIVNVASIGGLLPRPGDATYCATKAYLVMFSRALHAELADTGVQVQALCPGFTHTDFYQQSQYATYRVQAAVPGPLWMSADAVAGASVEAFTRDEAVCVPGLRNRLLVMLAKLGLGGLLARRLSTRL